MFEDIPLWLGIRHPQMRAIEIFLSRTWNPAKLTPCAFVADSKVKVAGKQFVAIGQTLQSILRVNAAYCGILEYQHGHGQLLHVGSLRLHHQARLYPTRRQLTRSSLVPSLVDDNSLQIINMRPCHLCPTARVQTRRRISLIWGTR